MTPRFEWSEPGTLEARSRPGGRARGRQGRWRRPRGPAQGVARRAGAGGQPAARGRPGRAPGGCRWCAGARAARDPRARGRSIPRSGPAGLRALAAGQIATPNVRNVATIAGNLLQRPRCWYFRGRPFAAPGRAATPASRRRPQRVPRRARDLCAVIHPSDLAVPPRMARPSSSRRGTAAARCRSSRCTSDRRGRPPRAPARVRRARGRDPGPAAARRAVREGEGARVGGLASRPRPRCSRSRAGAAPPPRSSSGRRRRCRGAPGRPRRCWSDRASTPPARTGLPAPPSRTRGRWPRTPTRSTCSGWRCAARSSAPGRSPDLGVRLRRVHLAQGEGAYGRGVDPASWATGDAPNDTFWCLRTMEPAGPDDRLVHAHRCRPSRACFEATPAAPILPTIPVRRRGRTRSDDEISRILEEAERAEASGTALVLATVVRAEAPPTGAPARACCCPRSDGSRAACPAAAKRDLLKRAFHRTAAGATLVEYDTRTDDDAAWGARSDATGCSSSGSSAFGPTIPFTRSAR